jgi:hypothetical protein
MGGTGGFPPNLKVSTKLIEGGFDQTLSVNLFCFLVKDPLSVSGGLRVVP